MPIDDITLQDEGEKPSRVDGRAEKLIMADYARKAHEEKVCAELDRMHRRQTIKQFIVFILLLVGIWVAVRTWIAPEWARQMESTVRGLF